MACPLRCPRALPPLLALQQRRQGLAGCSSLRWHWRARGAGKACGVALQPRRCCVAGRERRRAAEQQVQGAVLCSRCAAVQWSLEVEAAAAACPGAAAFQRAGERSRRRAPCVRRRGFQHASEASEAAAWSARAGARAAWEVGTGLAGTTRIRAELAPRWTSAVAGAGAERAGKHAVAGRARLARPRKRGARDDDALRAVRGNQAGRASRSRASQSSGPQPNAWSHVPAAQRRGNAGLPKALRGFPLAGSALETSEGCSVLLTHSRTCWQTYDLVWKDYFSWLGG